jgi:hypothetical protein
MVPEGNGSRNHFPKMVDVPPASSRHWSKAGRMPAVRPKQVRHGGAVQSPWQFLT